MSLRKRCYQTLGLILALGVWACGSDITGPDNGNFDAETTAAGLEVVDGAFSTPAFASLEALGGAFGVPGAAPPAAAAAMLRAAGDPNAADFSERISEAASGFLASRAAAAIVLIPEDYRSLTLTYDPEEGYAVDSTRTEAPSNGIRFILYAVNPITHEITEPLTEIGYADLTDESTETVAAIGLEVVSDDVTYLDYTVTLSGTIVTPVFTVSGFITDGTDRADFTLSQGYAVNIAGITINIDYEIAVNDFSMDVALEIVQTNDENETVAVDISFSDGSDIATIIGSTENQEGVLEVRGNGVLFATITLTDSSVTVLDGEGEPLTAEEIQTLQELIEVIDEVGDLCEDLLHPVEFLFDD